MGKRPLGLQVPYLVLLLAVLYLSTPPVAASAIRGMQEMSPKVRTAVARTERVGKRLISGATMIEPMH